MTDPLVNLIVFALTTVLMAAVFWPGRGLLSLVRRMARSTERVLVEDALKHLFNCERNGRSGTLESVAGRLAISRGHAGDLLTLLSRRGLARVGSRGFELTDVGRTYALRILRTHRLWERYLADRTGVPPGEWHGEAERVEHELSADEVEELAARLGHPLYDPHGDPIPTAGGSVPSLVGGSLSRARPDRSYVISHLEDEPPEVFSRLTAAGLAPGVRLDVLEEGPEGIRIHVAGEERVLGVGDAENVTVAPLPAGETVPDAARTLADAVAGEAVRVVRLSPACQGPQRRRLLDLGVVPGTLVVPELVSTSGDPVAYRIRGALVALRREQASWIEVEEAPVERTG
jgi:DtxR family Mn-dependent transcriptional regulator